VDCPKVNAVIRKHGGGRRSCLSSKGKEEELWKLEKKEKSREAWKEYKKSRQNTKRVISLA